MPYVQNTDQDRREMLAAIGASSIEDLFQSIPEAVRCRQPLNLPPALSEPEAMSHLRGLAAQNRNLDDLVSFLGAGMYDHYVPPVVDFIASRSEFTTSYTPYQAEASQGNLQVFYEYQSLICRLTGMDVANASLYDGASALAESVLMGLNLTGKQAVLVSPAVHPEYVDTLRTYVRNLGTPIESLPLEDGSTPGAGIGKATAARGSIGVVVVQQPNFLGVVEDLAALAEAAHRCGALLVVSVNPLALGVLRSPGECGADIVCGEGQVLGTPPSLGGPGLGLMATRLPFVRKMPGRLVGATRHTRGDRAFVLTLQTREQHIRRERATSNICTNHALLALRTAVYLSALGKHGLARVATLCVQRAHNLAERLAASGFPPVYSKPFFHEFVIDCRRPAEPVVDSLLAEGYLAGLPLGRFENARSNQLLLCVTEQRTEEQICDFAGRLSRALSAPASLRT